MRRMIRKVNCYILNKDHETTLYFKRKMLQSKLVLFSVLRPCFERYVNYHLVNSHPYHTEYHMKKEEDCLMFCAQTAVFSQNFPDAFSKISVPLPFSSLRYLRSCLSFLPG